MQVKLVREHAVISYTFDPHTSQSYYLHQSRSRYRITEESLLNGLINRQFQVPLKDHCQALDTAQICLCPKLAIIGLIFLNRLLIYSLKNGVLVFVAELGGKNAYNVELALISQQNLYFSASNQHNIYAINLDHVLKSKSIQSYTKYKIPSELRVAAMATCGRKLVAACSDFQIRCYDCESGSLLRSMAVEAEIRCIAVSPDNEYIAFGCRDGDVIVLDGYSIGEANTKLRDGIITKGQSVQAAVWYTSYGDSQTNRIILHLSDGTLRMHVFHVGRSKDRKQLGSLSEATMLWSTRINSNASNPDNNADMSQLSLSLTNQSVQAHPFSNFIHFLPAGILLYLNEPLSNSDRPVCSTMSSLSLAAFMPSKQAKQVNVEGSYYFVVSDKLFEVRDQIYELTSVLSVIDKANYRHVKPVRLAVRPNQVDSDNNSGIIRRTFLLSYVQCNLLGCLGFRRLRCWNNKLISYFHYKSMKQPQDDFSFQYDYASTLLPLTNILQYSPPSILYPDNQIRIILYSETHNCQTTDKPSVYALHQDRSTLTIANQFKWTTQEEMDKQFGKGFTLPSGLNQVTKLSAKVSHIYETPFRNGYTVLYLSDKVLRYSRNYLPQNNPLDMQIQSGGDHLLRLEATDIVSDVVWNSPVQFGAVVCLDKIYLVTKELKTIRVVLVDGYCVQGMWLGYGIIIVTRVDVQLVDLSGRSTQLYCKDQQQAVYTVAGILCDRVVGVVQGRVKSITKNTNSNSQQTPQEQSTVFYDRLSKPGQPTVACRYFSILQPLICGFLTYCRVSKSAHPTLNIAPHKMDPPPVDVLVTLVKTYSPVFIVTESMLEMMLQAGHWEIADYFVKQGLQLYSTRLRMHILCGWLGKELENAVYKDQFQHSLRQIASFGNKHYSNFSFSKKSIENKETKRKQLANTQRKLQQLRHIMLGLYELEGSSDIFDQMKLEQYRKALEKLVAPQSVERLKKAIRNGPPSTLKLGQTFGERAYVQVCWLDGKKYEIEGFKADNGGEWFGAYGRLIEMKEVRATKTGDNIGANKNELGINQTENGITNSADTNQPDSQYDQEQPFRKLLLYYRYDEGRGETVQDLSNSGVQGQLVASPNAEVTWLPCQEGPVDLEDKWGKKVPPQFALANAITQVHGLSVGRRPTVPNWTLSFWAKWGGMEKQEDWGVQPGFSEVPESKSNSNSGNINASHPLQLRLFRNGVHLSLLTDSKGLFWLSVAGKRHQFGPPKSFQGTKSPLNTDGPFMPPKFNESNTEWHFLSLSCHESKIQLVIDCELKMQLSVASSPIVLSECLQIGHSILHYTEFRLWSYVVPNQRLKENMKTPLDLVAQKKGKFKMRIKKKQPKQEQEEFGAFPL